MHKKTSTLQNLRVAIFDFEIKIFQEKTTFLDLNDPTSRTIYKIIKIKMKNKIEINRIK